jgi:hypothetical protein
VAEILDREGTPSGEAALDLKWSSQPLAEVGRVPCGGLLPTAAETVIGLTRFDGAEDDVDRGSSWSHRCRAVTG